METETKQPAKPVLFMNFPDDRLFIRKSCIVSIKQAGLSSTEITTDSGKVFTVHVDYNDVFTEFIAR